MTPKRSLVASVVLLIVAVAAWGGASASGAGSTIVIGANVPLSGALAAQGTAMKNAYQLAVDQINAAGGIKGHQLKLDIQDDRGDPATALQLAAQFATQDHVTAALGGYGSVVALPMTEKLDQYKIPNVQPVLSAVNASTRGLQYMVDLQLPVTQVEIPVDNYMTGYVHPKTAGIIYINQAYAKSVNAKFQNDMHRSNVPVTVSVQVTSGSPSFLPALSKIKAANPQLLKIVVAAPDCIVVVREMKELGLSPKYVTSNSATCYSPTDIAALGDSLNGFLNTLTWWPTAPYPGVPQFVKAFRAKAGQDPGTEAEAAYRAVQVLANAMKTAKDPTNREQIRTALHATNMDTIGGHVHFNAGGGLSGSSTVVQVQKGKPVIIWPKKLARGKLQPFVPWSSR